MIDDWRQRLLSAIETSPLSGREICRRAEVGSSFISDLKNAGKSPSAAYVVRVANAIPVSLTYVFAGIELSPETEEVIQLWSRLPAEMQNHLLAVARGLATDEPRLAGHAVGQHPSDSSDA